MNITWSAIVGILSLVASADNRPMTLPFHETFAGTKVDTAWTTDVSAGNTVTVENGAMRSARVSSDPPHPTRVGHRSDSCLVLLEAGRRGHLGDRVVPVLGAR